MEGHLCFLSGLTTCDLSVRVLYVKIRQHNLKMRVKSVTLCPTLACTIPTADIHQHVRPYYVHMKNSPTLLPRAMKPSTRQGCTEILEDPYSKKSPLPSIGISLIWLTPLSFPFLGTWPVKNTTETYHLLQPSKNRCIIEAHNAREFLLAVSLVEIS